jgi:hypothetical protein
VRALFVVLALPGFVLLCAAILALPLRRTRRFAYVLTAPGASLYGASLILAALTGQVARWHVFAGACFIGLGLVNAAGVILARHQRGWVPAPEPYDPPEGSYEFVTCTNCGLPVEALTNWTGSGSMFRCERCGPS